MSQEEITAPVGGVSEDSNRARAKDPDLALTKARARCRELSRQLLEAYDGLVETIDGSLSHLETEGQLENAQDGLRQILRDFGVYLSYPIFQHAEQDYRHRKPTTQIPLNSFGTLIEFDPTTYEPEELYYHGERNLEKVPLSEDRGWKLAVAMTALQPELVAVIEDMPFKMSIETGQSGYRCETQLYDLIGRLVETRQTSRHPNPSKRAIDSVAEFGLTNDAALHAIVAFWDYEIAVELLCEAIDRDEAVEDFHEFLNDNFNTPSEGVGSVLCDSSATHNPSPENGASEHEFANDEDFLKFLQTFEGDTSTVCAPPRGQQLNSENVSHGSAYKCRTFPEFVPDEIDLRMLAWAYLDEFLKLDMHMFTTGWSEKSYKRLERFEAIAKLLGTDVRREIIDDLDDCQAKGRGDVWHVYKQACESGFWTRPIDTAAVLREADSILSVSDDQLHHFGEDFLRILREAKGSVPSDSSTPA